MGAKTGGISGFLASAQAHLCEFVGVATMLPRGGNVANALIMNTDDVILSRNIVTRSGRLMVFCWRAMSSVCADLLVIRIRDWARSGPRQIRRVAVPL